MFDEILLQKLAALKEENVLSKKYYDILCQFYNCYKQATYPNILDEEQLVSLFTMYFDLLKQQSIKPFIFEPYHKKICSPINYYQFGLQLFRPLVDLSSSTLHGQKNIQKMLNQIEKKENVIFFANHQTEVDPVAIALLLEKKFSALAEKIIYVAGERVISDPLAVPISMGHNLLCIYSKKHINNEPKKKTEKQLHNKRTMGLMSNLLSEGGKAIYVAPSGGRDRLNGKNVPQIALFDTQSIEMFYLMAKRAKRPTHFYSLALATYPLLPPPDDLQKEMGEKRITSRCAIHIAFGKEIDMENYPGCKNKDRMIRRNKRTDTIYKRLLKDYAKISL